MSQSNQVALLIIILGLTAVCVFGQVPANQHVVIMVPQEGPTKHLAENQARAFQVLNAKLERIERRADFYVEAAQGLKMLAITTPPAATVLTVDKAVSKPTDLQGMKIAGGGKTKGQMISAVGAAPIEVKIAELYQALSRKLVDGDHVLHRFRPVQAA